MLPDTIIIAQEILGSITTSYSNTSIHLTSSVASLLGAREPCYVLGIALPKLNLLTAKWKRQTRGQMNALSQGWANKVHGPHLCLLL